MGIQSRTLLISIPARMQSYVAGITIANATNRLNNRIYGLANAGTSGVQQAQIVELCRALRNHSLNVFNNMISIGTGQVTNTAIIGIMGNHGSTPIRLTIFITTQLTLKGSCRRSTAKFWNCTYGLLVNCSYELRWISGIIL